MEIFAERIKALRLERGLSQEAVGRIIGVKRYAVYSYEKGRACPEMRGLVALAEYFDVSMDYLCCRTEKPQGRLYEFKPRILEEDKDMKQFVEMCFDPKSPMNDRLKKAIIEMLEGVKE